MNMHLPPPACRLCRIASADSSEHLFQSALGGRLEVAGILCKPCNDRMGHTIDADLVRALDWARMLLAIEGDRGQSASVRAVDPSGREVILNPGALAESARARPRVVQIDSDTMNMTSFSREQAREITEAYQRKRPGQTLVVKDVKVTKTFPGPTKFDVSLNIETFARAAVKSVLVLLGHLGLEDGDALANAWRFVRGDTTGDVGVRAHWSPLPGPWRDDSLGEAPHQVTMRSDPAADLVTADVRYFGDVAVCIQMRGQLSSSFEVGYGVDPLTGRQLHHRGWIGWIDTPGRADRESILDARDRAVFRIRRASESRGQAALEDQVLRECTRSVMGDRREPPSDAERDRIQACFDEEMAFIARREDREDDAPELVADLQAAADRVRLGRR